MFPHSLNINFKKSVLRAVKKIRELFFYSAWFIWHTPHYAFPVLRLP